MMSAETPQLIINKLQILEFCPILRIFARRWIFSQGNRGSENQSVTKNNELRTF